MKQNIEFIIEESAPLIETYPDIDAAFVKNNELTDKLLAKKGKLTKKDTTEMGVSLDKVKALCDTRAKQEYFNKKMRNKMADFKFAK